METISSKDNTSGNNYIAFFDLDRTIAKAISGNELVKGALRKNLMTYFDLARAIYLSLLYKLNLKDPRKIINEMVTWTKGISEQSMNELCHEVFRDVLLPSVFEEARLEIKAHKEKNAKVVILSSAPAQICMEMAKNLGMDDIICSDLEAIDGYLTGRPVGNLCFDVEKEIRLRAYCEMRYIKTSDVWYYGDSISDLPALNLAGNPVCINPDNKLKRIALQRGWKILWWN